MRKKEHGPATPYHEKITTRNRKWLEKKYGVDIPSDVEYILAGDNLELYLEESIESAIKLNGIPEKVYNDIEEID